MSTVAGADEPNHKPHGVNEKKELNSISDEQNLCSARPQEGLSPVDASFPSSAHVLLLLSDSALPLGSFAFSSGLESYLAHTKSKSATTTPSAQLASFHHFISLSLSSVAGLSIPYLLAAYRSPSKILTLDNDLDASIPCTVARRASVAQGRALLSVWERSLRSSNPTLAPGSEAASNALSTFSSSLKAPSPSFRLGPNGHFPLLWALVCCAKGVALSQTSYVFMFNHAKAVVSAAVRASVMGPYQAQGVLASGWLQGEIRMALERSYDIGIEEAGQEVPIMDLWIGRHELLYSRIFNS